jgi:hypothetical protein
MISTDDEKLMIITEKGGTYDLGTLLTFDPLENKVERLLDFKGPEAAFPSGSLLQAQNGKLYGVSADGGAYNLGSLFEFDPEHLQLETKFDFDGENGINPRIGMIQANNGKLYGTTSMGGTGIDSLNANSTSGTLFEFDPVTDILTKKIDFNGVPKGKFPVGKLVQGKNGKIYGTTDGGGTSELTYGLGVGTLFEWDPATETFEKKVDFQMENDSGFEPNGSMILDISGSMYGTTRNGGHFQDMNEFGGGILYNWDPDHNSYQKKYVFDSLEKGFRPIGGLVLADNGNYYGCTESGGIFFHEAHKMPERNGVLFEYNPLSGVYTKKIDFRTEETGYYPMGDLLKAHNGKLYGINKAGGAYSQGVLFEYDPATNIFVKKLDLGENENHSLRQEKIILPKQSPPGHMKGSVNPVLVKEIEVESLNYGSLTEVFFYNSYSTLARETCSEYISPSGKYTWSDSGIYHDTIPNATGHDSIITVDLKIKKISKTVNRNANILIAEEQNAEYQWIDCGKNNEVIDGATNRSFTAPEPGSYAVIITSGDCSDTSDCVEISISGLPDIASNVLLYPNPNNGSFTIDLGGIVAHMDISICETDGRVIRKYTVTNERYLSIDINAEPGLYLVKINLGNENMILKTSIK